MHCGQARQLFDAYVDGELSSSMATELDAHRLKCAECRRALALLEVSEHVLTSTKDPVRVRRDFTDRLVACIEDQQSPWSVRLRRGLYVGVPLAAAAVIALAFLGVFDRSRAGEFAGVTVDAADVELLMAPSVPADGRNGSLSTIPAASSDWARRVSESWDARRRTVANLRQVFDDVVSVPLQSLDEAGGDAVLNDDAGEDIPRDPEADPDDLESPDAPPPDEEDL